jgi:hypothetical protein
LAGLLFAVHHFFHVLVSFIAEFLVMISRFLDQIHRLVEWPSGFIGDPGKLFEKAVHHALRVVLEHIDGAAGIVEHHPSESNDLFGKILGFHIITSLRECCK